MENVACTVMLRQQFLTVHIWLPRLFSASARRRQTDKSPLKQCISSGPNRVLIWAIHCLLLISIYLSSLHIKRNKISRSKPLLKNTNKVCLSELWSRSLSPPPTTSQNWLASQTSKLLMSWQKSNSQICSFLYGYRYMSVLFQPLFDDGSFILCTDWVSYDLVSETATSENRLIFSEMFWLWGVQT